MNKKTEDEIRREKFKKDAEKRTEEKNKFVLIITIASVSIIGCLGLNILFNLIYSFFN